MKHCQNCGHDCHCKGYCLQENDEKETIICCTNCKHEEKDTANEDLFNGE